MWRKIRRFYWHRRDRGLGGQTIAVIVLLILLVFIMLGALVKSIAMPHSSINETVTPASTATGTAICTVPVTGAAVLEEETGSEEVASERDKEVDTTGLSSFLGFMSESAYEDLENQLTVLCRNRGCKSVKKLTYQQTKNTFDVTSFILLSDESVYQCDYNLKSCAVVLSETGYTESDVQQMKEQQLQAEQEKLKKQQQEEKKKLQKQKKASKKKSSKKKTKKKSAKKTSKKKKSKK